MSDTRDVRAGVVGVGSMGRHHARVYQELQGVDLVGVSDVDEDRAAEVADTYGTRPLSREDLLAAVDAVSIAVPTEYHYALAREAIDSGVDLLVEKPLVADPANGRELVRRARAADCTLQVGHIERYNPAVLALSDIADDLDVIAVDARRLGPPVDRDIDDSAVLDLMIHDLDVVLSLLDADVAGVAATGALDNQYITANVRFEGGVVGSFTASRVTQRKVRELSITADTCQVSVDYTDQSVQIHRQSVPEYIEANGDIRYRHESIIERPTVDNGEPLKKELRSFVNAAASGEPPLVTGEDGLRALVLANEIESLATGRESTIQQGVGW